MMYILLILMAPIPVEKPDPFAKVTKYGFHESQRWVGDGGAVAIRELFIRHPPYDPRFHIGDVIVSVGSTVIDGQDIWIGTGLMRHYRPGAKVKFVVLRERCIGEATRHEIIVTVSSEESNERHLQFQGR